MPESVHSQDLDQSMVDAEQPTELPQSNDPILEERQIVVVRIWTTDIRIDATINLWIYRKKEKKKRKSSSDHYSPQLPGATETAASFQFEGEGHTMGNALRYAIMKKWVYTVVVRLDSVFCTGCFLPGIEPLPPSSLGKNKNIISNY